MKRGIGAVAGLLVFGCVLALPLGVDEGAHRLAAVLALVVIFWVTEAIPIPVTALLGSALCVLLGVAPAQVVFAPYADPIIFLFLGAFLVGEAIGGTGLDGRLASFAVSLPAVRSSPRRLAAVLGVATALISMWMSNTAAAAVVMPLALSAIRTGGHQDKRFRGWVVLAVAYGASLGGIATPVGTPPNLIAVGFLREHAGIQVSFTSWMAVGLPLSLLLTLGFVGLAMLLVRKTGAAGVAPARREPWTRAQITTTIVFGVMIAGWLLPSLLLAVAPESAARAATERLPESVVALAAAIALFVLPASVRPYEPVLRWSQVAKVDWGTILLFGGGLSLGGLMLKTGLGSALGEVLMGATGVSSTTGLIALAAGTAVVLTEFMSNTAAANIVVPVIFALAVRLGLNPTGPVIAAALGASMAFMLPISTPPNAIAYGTGEVSIRQMIVRGVLLDLVAFGAIVLWVSVCYG